MSRKVNNERLELKIPAESNAQLVDAASKIEPGGRNLLGLKLLTYALQILMNRTSSALPFELQQMRKKLHNLGDDAYATDVQTSDVALIRAQAQLEVAQAKLEIAELKAENERLRRLCSENSATNIFDLLIEETLQAADTTQSIGDKMKQMAENLKAKGKAKIQASREK